MNIENGLLYIQQMQKKPHSTQLKGQSLSCRGLNAVLRHTNIDLLPARKQLNQSTKHHHHHATQTTPNSTASYLNTMYEVSMPQTPQIQHLN